MAFRKLNTNQSETTSTTPANDHMIFIRYVGGLIPWIDKKMSFTYFSQIIASLITFIGLSYIYGIYAPIYTPRKVFIFCCYNRYSVTALF